MIINVKERPHMRYNKRRCCQTNEPKHQCLVDGYCYEITKERYSVRAARQTYATNTE